MGSLYKLITKTNLGAPYIIFPLIIPIIFVLFFSTTMGAMTNQGLQTFLLHNGYLIPDTSGSGIIWNHIYTLSDAFTSYAKSSYISAQISVNAIIITVIAMTVMQNGIMNMGFNLLAIRKSVLIKRAGATSINKLDILGAVALYGMTVWLISTVWTILLSFLFSVSGLFFLVNNLDFNELSNLIGDFSPTEFQDAWNISVQEVGNELGVVLDSSKNWKFLIDWSSINILYLLVAAITGLYLSYGLGTMFVSISKNEPMFSAISALYFFLAMLLGGVAISGQGPDWMQTAGWFIPNAYNAGAFDVASGSAYVTDWMSNNGGYEMSQLVYILDITMPILFGTIAWFIAVKALKID